MDDNGDETDQKSGEWLLFSRTSHCIFKKKIKNNNIKINQSALDQSGCDLGG